MKSYWLMATVYLGCEKVLDMDSGENGYNCKFCINNFKKLVGNQMCAQPSPLLLVGAKMFFR